MSFMRSSTRIAENKVEQFKKDIENESYITKKIINLIKNEYDEKLPDILTIKNTKFMEDIQNEVLILLENKYTSCCLTNDKLKLILEKGINDIKNEYESCYELLNQSWRDYERSSKKGISSGKFEILINFRKHCYGSEDFASHNCGFKRNRFIIIKNKNNEKKYVICQACRKVYYTSFIKCFCKKCKVDFYTNILKSSEDSNLLPATWENYHCPKILNEEMKCIKCQSQFRLNMKNGMLYCTNKNCGYIIKPTNIIWSCTVCYKDFKSMAIPYNPLEVILVKKVIRQTLLLKHRAHPNKIPCCDINVYLTDFFHKKLCQGILFQGELNDKMIIVCEMCRAISFYDRFIWTCPKCGKKFRDLTNVIREEQYEKDKNNSGIKPDFEKEQEKNDDLWEKVKKQSIKAVIDSPVKNIKKKNYKGLSEFLISRKKKDKENQDEDVIANFRKKEMFSENKFPVNKNKVIDIYEQKIKKITDFNMKQNNRIVTPIKSPGKNNDRNKMKSPIKNKEKSPIKSEIKCLIKNSNKKTPIKSPKKFEVKSPKRSPKNLEDKSPKRSPKNLEDKSPKRSQNRNCLNSPKIKNVSNSPNNDKSINKDKKDKDKEEDIKIDRDNEEVYIEECIIDLNKGAKNVEKENLQNGKNNFEVKDKQYEQDKEKEKGLENKEKVQPKIEENKDKNPSKIDKEVKKKNYIMPNKMNNISSHLMNHINKRINYILDKLNLPIINIDEYMLTRKLGEGSYGIIYSATKDHKKYAIKKIIAQSLNEIDDFTKEFEIVYNCEHPNIMKIYGVSIRILDNTTFALYVLMEIADNDWEREIRRRLMRRQRYTENELINIIRSLTDALLFIQTKLKVSHRDIKPQNILVFPNGVYKLADFGEAKEVKISKRLNTLRGTELYMSPALFEGLKRGENDIRHDPFKSDMFSLGFCLLYASTLNFEILYAARECDSDDMINNLINKSYLPKIYSQKLVTILINMLMIDEKKRFNFQELLNYIDENYKN